MSNTRLAFLATLALGAAACSDAPAGTELGPVERPLAQAVDAVVPGEVLVGLREGASLNELTAERGLRLSRSGVDARFAVLGVQRGRELETAARLAADPRVEWAEPNYLRQPHAIDARLWAFFNPGGMQAAFADGSGPLPAGYTALNDADIDNVQGYAAGGDAVIVGSIDSGADLDHPELAGRVIAGRDWYNNDNDPSDDNGHGTHTTGTMVGASVGVAGVAGANVKAYVQKVCGPPGCPTSAIVNAIYAAADYPGLVAMNLSLGGGRLSRAEKQAIQYATDRGVLVIGSAGNAGSGKVECPACDDNAVSVSATTWFDGLAYYSSYGRGLDLSAPGGELYSNTTDEMGIWSSYLNGTYAYLQGTSMAAPQVTGTAGVVASVTGLRGAALRARLESTADDLGKKGYDSTYGNGRVNTYRAVTGGSLAPGL